MNADFEAAPPEALTAQAARLKGLYVAALAAVACLSILGQVLVQWSLQRQLSDSTVVNIAGRQRMLSQQLTKAALALRQTTSTEDRVARSAEIETTLAQWTRAEGALRAGDAELGLPGRNSPAIEAQLRRLEPHFAAMVAAAGDLLVKPDATAVERLLQHEPAFSAAMDSIVRTYEQEARARVATLRAVEQGLLLVTLAVLACEGWFIFRPAVRRIRSAAAALLESRQALDIARRKAESANEAKSRFLALVSHELRNPLQAVLGSAELARELGDDQARREHLDIITDAGRSLLGLLNDLLDMARIEAGKLDIVAAPLDPVLVVEQTLALLAPQFRERELRLEREFAADLPAAVLGDELRIRQVLLNLLGNALKFTAEGSVQARLLRITRDGVAKLRWEIKDTGRGIPAEQQAAVFTPFTQLHESDRPGGAGLGLAICRRLVELMGGEIGVESQPGAGSLFWFELPLVPAPLPESAVAPAETQFAPRRVLIVDDDPVNRRLLGEMIRNLHHHAVTAADGAEALALLQSQSFDIALVDWQMPGLNGGALAAAVRAAECELDRKPLQLIAISAGTLPTDEAGGELFQQWLTKPVGSTELAAALGQRSLDRWAGPLARLNGRRDLLAQLAADFRAGLPQLLAELRTAFAANQPREVARLAHLLAGQAGTFSAEDAVAAAQALEEQSQEGEPLKSSVDQVIQRLEQLATDLAERISPRNIEGR